MISVEEAEAIILNTIKDFGREQISFTKAVGRILAEPVKADRDMPPFNRVAMDGIAIKYEAIEKGIKKLHVKGVQTAGDEPIQIENIDECIEIMTGCALPQTTDTVIRYEDIVIADGIATVQSANLKKEQNVHKQGTDRKKAEVVINAGQLITPAVINVAASVGATTLCVKRLPKAIIISTGNELVDVNDQPSLQQIRQSNNYTIQAALKPYGIDADLLHIQDDLNETKKVLEKILQEYDVLIFSGGVSAGKFDYLPKALEDIGVKKLFHKVAQKPGKPFWFGEAKNGSLVFAFPGNPVSALLCLHRYLIPWLQNSIGFSRRKYFAVLEEDVVFSPALTNFLQVKLKTNEEAKLKACPVRGNGSGDLVSLTEADAFMELPAERTLFLKGEVYSVWPFKEWL